jgi:hypothetical protein
MQVRKSATCLVAHLQGVQPLLPENLVDQVLYTKYWKMCLCKYFGPRYLLNYFQENPLPDSLNSDRKKFFDKLIFNIP